MKFYDRHIEVTERPVIIVGERPGRQRKKDRNQQCFHGNRTGDFVESVIDGKINIILTNVQQEYYSGSLRLTGIEHVNGFYALNSLIRKMNPRHIICLGKYAHESVMCIIHLPQDCKVTSLPHPSWTLRFNKSKKLYYEALQYD